MIVQPLASNPGGSPSFASAIRRPGPASWRPFLAFTGRLLQETTVGPYRAVVPTISGTAWVTGIAEYVVDPDDPFPDGFTVGDIWG